MRSSIPMTSLPDALIALESALEQVSAAMATGSPDSVLAAEESLGVAVRQLVAAAVPAGADRSKLAAGIRTVRQAMAKCQRLGRVSASCLQAITADQPYTASGQLQPAIVTSLDSRV